jgi:chemotaxis protein MotB
MKKTIFVLFVLIYSLLSSASWSDSIDDLTLRNGVFYKRYTDVPFSGSITGKINVRLENGKFEGHFDGYYDDGQLKEKGSYKSGKRTGLWEEFSKGGETLETTAWMNDSFITQTGALSSLEKVQLLYKVETRDLELTLKDVLREQVKDKDLISQQLVKVKRQEILLSEAKVRLQGEKEINIESRLLVESLNQQLAEVRGQIRQFQSLLDASDALDAAKDIKIKNLSSKLNAALARLASEQRKNSRELTAQNTKLKALAIERDKEKQLLAELKQRERERLEAEAKELKKYQSKFFVEVEKALGDQEGIKIKGDRFVLSSEILFDKGKADISQRGLNQIKLVADIMTSISNRIPPEINWILRVDGHTDNVPLSGRGIYKDNWEVSQARALSVVRYMSEELGVPSNRLAATGFGEYQPFDPTNTDEARAKNRRIEIKITER